MAILSRRLILLAILLYEQFVHHTQINLRPNTQLLSTQQHAYQSFLITFWFNSVCVTEPRSVNFRENIYINMNYSYPTTMYESIFAQMYIFIVEKYFFAIFALIKFMVKSKNCKYTRNTYIRANILSYIVVRKL